MEDTASSINEKSQRPDRLGEDEATAYIQMHLSTQPAR